MKSKSPFAMKSPLLAYKSDMKGNYANPEYVPETIVGAEIGANIAKTAASVFDSYANSKKSAQSDSKKAFDEFASTEFTKFDSGLSNDFRLKGKGIKSVRGGKIGDLMCSIHIETPVNLSEEQKNILMQFDDKLKNSTKKHSPKSQSWVDGLKSFFK